MRWQRRAGRQPPSEYNSAMASFRMASKFSACAALHRNALRCCRIAHQICAPEEEPQVLGCWPCAGKTGLVQRTAAVADRIETPRHLSRCVAELHRNRFCAAHTMRICRISLMWRKDRVRTKSSSGKREMRSTPSKQSLGDGVRCLARAEAHVHQTSAYPNEPDCKLNVGVVWRDMPL